MNGDLRDERDVLRRRLILEAAKACFLQFGYAKTSFDDIAQRAGISRPLIYKKFKNKEELLSGVYDFILDPIYPKVEQLLERKGGSTREKLFALWELLLLEPYDEWMRMPMAAAFQAACHRVAPEVMERHDRLQLAYTQAVLGSKELSEVFILAACGLGADIPTTRALRARLQVLVERFTPAPRS
ncbi:TetR/AcrR family transcriptional regulator [Archangium violaceum]|uniref:TetR/AcrR family transcriptional regulator n=1 Tax=Archangium violaceum TaxID=83451 RepID=UPI00194DD40B|nr:TetR/AcrR family transcriptional regulator [Archangium violaceum]QRN95910.1 TetR/AcrR family transcriptional regulator [Archangium violaceum]